MTVDAFTGEEKKIKIASLISNENAPNGYVRSERSPFSGYGILVDQVSISKIEYDEKVNRQIEAQQQANMSIQTKKAEAQCLKIARAINADETDSMYAIEGWCSANGDPYKNQKLSEDRAMSVLLELKRLGVDSTRLYIVGNGMGDEDSVLEQKVVVRKTF